jgi:hypothetical protein
MQGEQLGEMLARVGEAMGTFPFAPVKTFSAATSFVTRKKAIDDPDNHLARGM